MREDVRQVDALREDVHHLTRRLLAADDRHTIACLMPMVHALLDSSAWTLADLFARANKRGPLAADALLALIAQYTSEIGGRRALGNLLARCEGVTIAGLRLVRLDRRTGADAIYAVHRVSKGA